MKKTKHKDKLVMLIIIQVTRITFSIGFCLEQQTKKKRSSISPSFTQRAGLSELQNVDA